MSAEQLVIVGSGPAGLTAALYAARANLSPLVLDGLQPGGQLVTTTAVENYPGFPEAVSGPDLVQRMRRQAERFGARFLAGDVAGADFSADPLTLRLSDGTVCAAQAVIIATGASALYLGLESEQRFIGRGVSACATCDGDFYRERPVAVVGGGDTAMEEALYLARLCSRVTLIHRRDQFRASRIMGERIRHNPKIAILWNTVVDEVLDVAQDEMTGLRLRNVKTGERAMLAVAGVFVAIGHRPNTAPFRGQVPLNEQGFIAADRTRTGVAGVFAAGDVQDPVYRQAVTAAGSGCMAALEAARYLESRGL